MKLHHANLAAFRAIIHTGSFEAAARQLHVTPSAISQRIKQLEDQLGQVLLVRAAPCCATASGQVLLQHSEQIALMENALLGSFGLGEPQTLSVSVNMDSVESWFMDAMSQVYSQHGILFDLYVEDQDFSEALLRSGEVMAAVSTRPEAIQGCRVEPLGCMRYFAWASPELVSRYFSSHETCQALRHAPMLVFNRKDNLQAQFLATFNVADANPPCQFIPSNTAFARAMVNGLGWGMLPDYIARPYSDTGQLVCLSLADPVDIRLYWHCWNIHSAALDALTSCVRAAAREQLQPW